MNVVGARIRQLRMKQGLTQKQLAAKVNVSSQVISNWERGYTNPNDEDIAALSDALNTSADYLLGRLDDPQPLADKNIPPWLTKRVIREFQKILEEQKETLVHKAAINKEDWEEIRRILDILYLDLKKRQESGKSESGTDEE